eukprot:3647583-Karenia_brevis.AAC.1
MSRTKMHKQWLSRIAFSFNAAMSRSGSHSWLWRDQLLRCRHYSMRCDSWRLLLDVISFNAAIPACKKGGQWQRVVPLFDKMRQLAGITSCDQLQRSHLNLREGWTVAACGTIVR